MSRQKKQTWVRKKNIKKKNNHRGERHRLKRRTRRKQMGGRLWTGSKREMERVTIIHEYTEDTSMDKEKQHQEGKQRGRREA